MIKLCFVVYDLSVVGGVERVVERLANRLTNFYSVHIISLHGDVVNDALNFNQSILIKFMHLSHSRLRSQLLEGTIKLGSYFRSNRIDIAFLEATFAGFIGCPLGLLSRTKIVFCDHGALLNQIDEKDIRMMRRISSLLSNHIVVLTRKSKEDYEKIFRVNSKRISYIYNWINTSTIDNDRNYNIDSKIIITAGRFTKEKGFDLLLEVAKLVMPNHPEWKWYLYGTGPLKEMIERRIEKYGLEHAVIIKGFTSNMESVYKQSSIYVLPSYREGIPLVLLEAKAYKLPSISFDIITGPNEIIENDVNGYLINPYDINEMSRKLSFLMEHPEKRLLFANNAYSNICIFSEDQILSNWKNLINRLLY